MELLLSSKKLVFTSLICFVIVFSQCKQLENEKNAADTCTSQEPLNPNGDSELSLLMRNMVHNSESLKDLIKQGNLPEKFPEEFLKIHTAKPTDSNTKKVSFDGYATSYIINLQTLYNSQKSELTINYNAVISTCVGCHKDHCPGPLPTIKKLSIE